MPIVSCIRPFPRLSSTALVRILAATDHLVRRLSEKCQQSHAAHHASLPTMMMLSSSEPGEKYPVPNAEGKSHRLAQYSCPLTSLLPPVRSRLKLKCDKKVPCGSCVRRGCTTICPNGELLSGLYFACYTLHFIQAVCQQGKVQGKSNPRGRPYTSLTLLYKICTR